MIYTMQNTADIGRYVKRVVDANGLHYTYVKEVDTDTGRIVYLRTDKDGVLTVDEDRGEFIEETVQAAPPILVIFHNREG